MLVADIDLENKEWKRIFPDSGYITEAYAGTFDGAFHTITGLKVTASASNQGLFGGIGLAAADGKTVTATIKNLKVEGSVTTSNTNVGGIVGQLFAGSVENCSFTGIVSSSKAKAYIGGIVGYANGDKPDKRPALKISGCVNRASVQTAGNAQNTVAGGIVGYAKYTEITDCYNAGTVSGTSRTAASAVSFRITSRLPIAITSQNERLLGPASLPDFCTAPQALQTAIIRKPLSVQVPVK